MSRKNAAILLALVMTVQSAAGAAAGEVPEGILQETEAFAELEASVYSDEESLLPADESAEEVEIVQEEDYSDEILSGEDMIIEADSAEEDILDVQGFPTEDESALELFEEDDSSLIAASDDGGSDEDFFELNGDYFYNVDPGASLTLELPAEQTAGGSGFSWTKRVKEPFVDEYGFLYDETSVRLEGETSPQLQLDQIQETALYTLSWITADNNDVSRSFTVTVKNGFRTYSAQESGSFELEENEQITLSIDARANDTEGMRYLWFSSQNLSSYQKLDASGSSYTVTAPRNATQYVCYVIDKYHNAAQYNFYAAIRNLIYDGPQSIFVAVSKGQTYTMESPVTTLDGTDDQLEYSWMYNFNRLDGVSTSSYTPTQIQDGDWYMCKVTDHLGNFYDLYWYFTVPEDGSDLVLKYEKYYQVPYGSDVSLIVTAASGDTDTPITYQWYSSTYDWDTDEEELIPLPGQTQPVLVLQNLQESRGYVCEVTQGGNSESAEIFVSVYSKLKVDMPENANSAFVVAPDSQGNATLSVNAVTDQGSLEYSWKNGGNYNTIEEGVSTITVSKPGFYFCNVSDGISDETVYFLVGNPTAGSTDMASAPQLSTETPMMITHALNRMVYVKLEEEGEIGFRSVSNCQVSLLNAAGDVISETEGFGDDFYYDPEEDDSPAYLAITTDYQDGLDDPVTLVWYAGQGSGGYDDSEWGPWYLVSEPTCTSPGIIRRDHLYEEDRYEQDIFGSPLGHIFGPAVETVAPTVFAPGRTESICSRCGAVFPSELPKLSSYLALNASGTVPLQIKKSSSAIEAVEMAAGDYLLSADSSNAKLGLTVGVSGNKVTVKAGKKTGSSVITVRTAGGASASFKVKVQKGKVVAKKAVGFPKNLTLVKGQTYTLNPVITPITTPDKLKYSSSAKKVASVSKSGVIVAKNKGKAVITLKVGKKTFKCKVKVS